MFTTHRSVIWAYNIPRITRSKNAMPDWPEPSPHHPQVFAEPMGHKGLRPVFVACITRITRRLVTPSGEFVPSANI